MPGLSRFAAVSAVFSVAGVRIFAVGGASCEAAYRSAVIPAPKPAPSAASNSANFKGVIKRITFSYSFDSFHFEGNRYKLYPIPSQPL